MGSRTIIKNIPKERMIFEKITPKRFWFILFPFLAPTFFYYLYVLASFNLNFITVVLIFILAIIVSFVFLGVCNIKFNETGFEILYDYITKSNTIFLEGGKVVNVKKNIRTQKRKK